MDNDNGGDGEEGGGDGPVQQPLLAIESLDDYVQRFGLSHSVGKTYNNSSNVFRPCVLFLIICAPFHQLS